VPGSWRTPHSRVRGRWSGMLNGCTVKSFLKKSSSQRSSCPCSRMSSTCAPSMFRPKHGLVPANALLVISGAFGVFRKERWSRSAGYRPRVAGHGPGGPPASPRARAERPYASPLVPDPICWTEVPGDLRSLMGQRMRWQRGLAESSSRTSTGCWRAWGWLAGLSVHAAVRVARSIVEIVGYIAMIILWWLT